jgi:hypothetical protein
MPREGGTGRIVYHRARAPSTAPARHNPHRVISSLTRGPRGYILPPMTREIGRKRPGSGAGPRGHGWCGPGWQEVGGLGRTALVAWWAMSVAGCMPTKDNPDTCKRHSECESEACDLTTYKCIPVRANGGAGGNRGGTGGATGGGGTVTGGGGASGGVPGSASGGTIGADGGADRATGGGDAAVEMQVGCPAACTGTTPICDPSHVCRVCQNGECTGATPVCSPTGACVGCLAHMDCQTATKPLCNPTAHVCEGCTLDMSCMARNTMLPACLAATGACVPCTTANLSRCSGMTPVCTGPGNTCGPCGGDSDCMAKDPTNPVCVRTGTLTGSCVKCTTTNTNQCSGATPVCTGPGNTCGPCAGDSDCMAKDPTNPVCVRTGTLTGSCVKCSTTNTSQCSGATPVCTGPGNTCGPCAGDSECMTKNAAMPACLRTGTLTGSCVKCTTTNISQCSGATPVCTGPGNTCGPCAGDSDCMTKNAAMPACIQSGTGLGSCVPCTASTHCTTDITKPICSGPNNTCAGCTSDTQCVAKLGSPDPGVCMFHTDGHCATQAEVLYVRATPTVCTDSGTGLVSAPFCSPQAAVSALTTARSTIVIRPGTIVTDRLSYAGGVSRLTVIGQDGAVIGPVNTAPPVTGITVTAGDVYIRGLSVTGMSGVGIVAVTPATIRLDRCLVIGNMGGLAVNGASFAINNCVFANNASNNVTAPPSSFGGVYLLGTATGTAQFRNNTIVGNLGPGLVCGSAYQTRGLLVANNVGTPVSTCMTDGSSFITTTTTATIFDASRGFHLVTGSPCVDREVGTTDFPADDLDGNARPSGAASDCGADEL